MNNAVVLIGLTITALIGLHCSNETPKPNRTEVESPARDIKIETRPGQQLTSSPVSAGLEHAQQKCDSIFEALWNVCRLQFSGLKAKPALRLDGKEKFGAYYDPRSNTIGVEFSSYQVCQRLGDAALAFLIGHELGHAMMEGKKNEASYFLPASTRTQREETAADNFGAFEAYLAGYRLDDVLPKMIDGLYDRYHFDEQLYPREPRKQKARQTEILLQQLIILYQSAPKLSTMGRYEEAASAYKIIANFYEGAELRNAAASNYLLRTINGKIRPDSLAYPVEVVQQTWLNPSYGQPGDRLPVDLYYANLALDQLNEALKINPGFIPARINRMCVFILQNALDSCFAEQATIEALSPSKHQKALMQLAVAIACIKKGETNQAKGFLLPLTKNANQGISAAAYHNLLIINKEKLPIAPLQNTVLQYCTDEAVPYNLLQNMQWREAYQPGMSVAYYQQAPDMEMASFQISIQEKIIIRQYSGAKCQQAWRANKGYIPAPKVFAAEGGCFVTIPGTSAGFELNQAGNPINYFTCCLLK